MTTIAPTTIPAIAPAGKLDDLDVVVVVGVEMGSVVAVAVGVGAVGVGVADKAIALVGTKTLE